jgi:hypothetical protein
MQVLTYDSAMISELINDSGGRPQLVRDAILVLEGLRLAENFGLPLGLDDFAAGEQNEAPNVPRPPKVYVLKEFSGRLPNRPRRKIARTFALCYIRPPVPSVRNQIDPMLLLAGCTVLAAC